MVGGKVIEIIPVSILTDTNTPAVWINCQGAGIESKETCAVYVEHSDVSTHIQVGDSLWWQGGFAYWTPKGEGREFVCPHTEHADCNSHNSDIRIPRIGFSGVERPAEALWQM